MNEKILLRLNNEKYGKKIIYLKNIYNTRKQYRYRFGLEYLAGNYSHYKSNPEYLVRNPVQAVLQSNKRLKAKHIFEYFWLSMTLRPKGVQDFILDVFKVHS